MSNATPAATANGLPAAPREGKAAANDALFHRAGHEIRNQLSVILLQLGKIADPAARQIEADVQAASDTVNRISMLLRVLNEPEVRLDDVELAAIAVEATRQAGAREPDRTHRIELIDQGNSSVRGNPSYLREAIANLLDNAIRHAPTTGRIVVACGSGPVVTIDDEGPGIPAGQMARLVEPFNVGNSPRPGAGLGLPLAKRIAELHGGEVRIERSPLGGARAVLNLPAATTTARAAP